MSNFFRQRGIVLAAVIAMGVSFIGPTAIACTCASFFQPHAATDAPDGCECCPAEQRATPEACCDAVPPRDNFDANRHACSEPADTKVCGCDDESATAREDKNGVVNHRSVAHAPAIVGIRVAAVIEANGPRPSPTLFLPPKTAPFLINCVILR